MIENIMTATIIAISVGTVIAIAYIKLETKIVRNQIKLLNQSESIADLQEKIEELESSNSYLRERVHELDGNTEEEF